jgi:hypothetical protein
MEYSLLVEGVATLQMYQWNKMMKRHVRTIAALSVSLMASPAMLALKADERNKKTLLKINQPVDVQGTVLPAGLYVLKVADSSADRHTVQILNANENHLFAIILATPVYRRERTANSQFAFYDVVAGNPPALRAWFYPGDNFGFEFGPGRAGGIPQSRAPHHNASASNGRSE